MGGVKQMAIIRYAAGAAALLVSACASLNTALAPLSLDDELKRDTEPQLRRRLQADTSELIGMLCQGITTAGDCNASAVAYFRAVYAVINIKHQQNLGAAPACIAKFIDSEEDLQRIALSGVVGLGEQNTCAVAVCQWRRTMYVIGAKDCLQVTANKG
jgi:hypothetical protein